MTNTFSANHTSMASAEDEGIDMFTPAENALICVINAAMEGDATDIEGFEMDEHGGLFLHHGGKMFRLRLDPVCTECRGTCEKPAGFPSCGECGGSGAARTR